MEKKFIKRWQVEEEVANDHGCIFVIGLYEGKKALGAYWEHNNYPNYHGNSAPFVIPPNTRKELIKGMLSETKAKDFFGED